MKLKNDLLLRAARGEKVERTPVWLMRQAGRILPEYRAVREQIKSFKTLVETPEAAAEVTIQPVDILGVDAAIIFSDILVIPEAMGLPYEMVEKQGPYFPEVISSKNDIDRLKIADGAEDLWYVMEALKLTKSNLKGRVPLIGFSGAPWTLMAYMLEGGGSKTFSKARRMLYTEPRLSATLLEKITASIISYVKAQVSAGADLIQIFDSWAGVLPHSHYLEFSLKYIEVICQEITEVPVTVFAKGAYTARKEFGDLSCAVIGLDWNMTIDKSRSLVGPEKTLQGNLDPCVLYGSEELIREETHKMLKAFGPSRHIANLGHGVYPDTPKEKVKLFVETVQQFNHEV
jgi:uroporphyrinogen decarboxylase